jgi:hypothetical protein
MAEPQPIPVPTSYRAAWFPVSVRLPREPGGLEPKVIRVAKVWATPQGLYVYTAPPDDRATNPASIGTPEFFSPIDYDKTPKPSGEYAARQKAIRIITDAGDVRLQRLGGCGCSHRNLKNWRPTWATRNEAWEA